MILFVIAIILFICSLLRYQRMSLLKRCNIPGPSPNFLFGNMAKFYEMGSVNYHSYLSRTYGPICGYYIGGKPFILITEPVEEDSDCLMTRIFQSQSGHFLTRLRRVPGGINADPRRNMMLGNLPVDEWRNTRKILQSAFSGNRLKQLLPRIDDEISLLIRQLQDNVHKEIDIFQFYQRFVVSLIARVIFGFEPNDQEDLTEKLVHISQQATKKSKFIDNLLMKVYFIFPELDSVFKWLRIIAFHLRIALGIEKRSELWTIARHVTKVRRQLVEKNQQEHFLDILINSELTDSEIHACYIVFFESVFDNLSAGLTFFTHILVNNKEVQHLLREEVRDNYSGEDVFGCDTIANLKLMDSAITEMFRLHAPETVLSRACDRTLRYKSHVIPEGVHLAIGTYQIHRCAQIWKEPERYLVDRFFNKGYVNSLNWQAFGAGPRQCFGFQLSYLVIKLLTARLLVNFEINATDNTDVELRLVHKVATIAPRSGLKAMLTPNT